MLIENIAGIYDAYKRGFMFVYSQSTGALWNAAGALIGVGYSGFGEGKDNPDMQEQVGVGPIPIGGYTICDPEDSPELGPVAMKLSPDPDTHLFGRAGFYIHGDDIEHPGCGSHGCICISRVAREYVAASKDRRLYVQA